MAAARDISAGTWNNKDMRILGMCGRRELAATVFALSLLIGGLSGQVPAKVTETEGIGGVVRVRLRVQLRVELPWEGWSGGGMGGFGRVAGVGWTGECGCWLIGEGWEECRLVWGGWGVCCRCPWGSWEREGGWWI